MAQYRVVAEWTQANGSVAQNVLYANIINGEVADQADLIQDIADTVYDIMLDWLASVATNVILALVRIYLFDQSTGLSTPVGVGVINEAGTGGGSSLPAGVSVKYNLYLEGRSRPFGAYLPGPATLAAGSNGLIASTGTANALVTALNMTVNHSMALTGLVFRPRVYSPKDSLTLDAVGADAEVNNVFDYQRRRKSGVGV